MPADAADEVSVASAITAQPAHVQRIERLLIAISLYELPKIRPGTESSLAGCESTHAVLLWFEP